MNDQKQSFDLAAGERLDVFTVADRGRGRDPFWRLLGSAWVNKDGSISCRLDANPVNGEIILKRPKEHGDAQG